MRAPRVANLNETWSSVNESRPVKSRAATLVLEKLRSQFWAEVVAIMMTKGLLVTSVNLTDHIPTPPHPDKNPQVDQEHTQIAFFLGANHPTYRWAATDPPKTYAYS